MLNALMPFSAPPSRLLRVYSLMLLSGSLALGCAACQKKQSDPLRIYEHGQPTTQAQAPQISGGDRVPAPHHTALGLAEILTQSSGEITFALETSSGQPTQVWVRAFYRGTPDPREITATAPSEIRIPSSLWNERESFGLTQVEVLSQQNSPNPLRTLEGPDLEELKSKAIGGIRVTLQLDSNRKGISSVRVSKQDATATANYHVGLLNRVRSAKNLDADQLASILDSLYFSSEAFERLERTYTLLSARSEPVAVAQTQVVAAQLSLVREFSGRGNQILSEGMTRLADLDRIQGIALLKRAYPDAASTSEARPAFQAFLSAFPPQDAETCEELLALSKRKRQTEIATRIASDCFQARPGSAAALIEMADGIEVGEALDRLLVDSIPVLTTISIDEAHHLLRGLRTDVGIRPGSALIFARISPKPSVAQNLALIQTLPAGAARDQVVLDAATTWPHLSDPERAAALDTCYLPESRTAFLKILKP